MNTYELTIVLPGKASAVKKKSVIEKITKIVKTLKGRVTKTDDWGELGFAYNIAKSETGVFLYFDIELDVESAKSLPEKLKMEEDFLRYLIVKKE